MQIVSIIRNRNQLTLPHSIRQDIDWLDVNSAVLIEKTTSGEITIKPHRVKLSKEEVLAKIKKIRKLKKRPGVSSALEFILQDRQRL